jgi:hypothetical protein
LLVRLMIPVSVFIRVSFFLTQRLPEADFSASLRCHSIWRNARGSEQSGFSFE